MTDETQSQSHDLADLLGGSDVHPSVSAMMEFMRDPKITEIQMNGPRTMYYTTEGIRRKANTAMFPSDTEYEAWINHVLSVNTDAKYGTLEAANGVVAVIEGSLRGGDLYGSIHVVTPAITKTYPIVTVRKQPRRFITLDQMAKEQNMMSETMRVFLSAAIKGRLNILITGGSGAGKTTMIRALSRFVDPEHRIITVEEINELHLQQPNVVPMFTYSERDAEGRLVWDVSLDDLCREALRMRPDRIWVGEVRGKEAFSLAKAAMTGHDGSLATAHADSPRRALKNLMVYIQQGEGGIPEDTARDMITQAFDLIIHIQKVGYGRRVVTHIVEVENATEGKEVRLNPLWTYNTESDSWSNPPGIPTPSMGRKLEQYGVNWKNLNVTQP